MADTEHKVRALQGLDPITPVLGGLAPLSVLRWSPAGAVMRAQDTIPASTRRIIAEWSLSGSNVWSAPEGTNADILLGSVVSPGAAWRVLGTYSANLTPGSELRAYAVASPAGLTQDGAPTHHTGFYGAVRVGVTWTNGASTTGPHYKSTSTPGSSEDEGDASDGGGQNWTNLRVHDIGRMSPPEYTSDPAVAAAYSEGTSAEIEIAISGNPRLQQVVVFEAPLSHTTEHDDDGLTSIHAMPPSNVAITPGPMTRAPDGATYEEHRHGTRRTMQVAERQSERLGPRILHWVAWNEAEADIWEQSEATPVSTTSATFVGLTDATLTTYSNDTPGWLCGAAYAKLARLAESVLIGRNEISALPVRVRVDAERSVANGVVRVQCGSYDWVDVTVTGARGVYEATGYLQSPVHADQDAPPIAIWIRALAGGTLSVYSVSVDFGFH